MALKDKLVVELSMEDLNGSGYYYTNLIFPATEGQVEDALQRVRGIGREDNLEFSVMNYNKLPELKDIRISGATINELNFFAKRIEMLNENETAALKAVFNKHLESEEIDDWIDIKDMINLTYGLENCYVIPGVSSDDDYGRLVIENEMMESIKKMDEEAVEMLDAKTVGAKQREMEKGEYVDGNYVTTFAYKMPEAYDGKVLPELKNEKIGGGFIQMLVAKSGIENPEEAKKSAVLIGLPIDTETANTIAQSLGEKRIEDCAYFELQSPLSWLDDGVYGSNELFGKLNNLAFVYEKLNADDKIKFKAVTEGLQCRDLDAAKEIINNLDKYQVSHYTFDYETYAKVYMQINLPTDFDISILERCNLANLGRTLCDRLDCKLTDYGVISKEDGQLFAIVTPEAEEQEEVQEEETEQEIGGMQM